MSLTIYNNGATNTVTSGTFTGGILIAPDPSTGNPTTLILSNATVTGQNAHETYPPSTSTDVEPGYHGITVMPGCTYTDAGNNTVRGGDGLAGKTIETYDSSPALLLPFYNPGDGLYAIEATVTLGGGSTYTGGDYTPGATGSTPTLGGAGATIVEPVSLTLTSLSDATFTGGASESTLQGAPGMVLDLVTGSGQSIASGIYQGGTGASTGYSLALSSAAANNTTITRGTFSAPFGISLPSGASLTFQWSSPGALSTSSVSGTLFGGNSILQPIVGGSGGTVITGSGPPPFSTLQF